MPVVTTPKANVLDEGTLRFSIESRILRELGERLVKQPDVALLELVKNSYDAEATICTILNDSADKIVVEDDGSGMTLDEFKKGWMRIGTSAKEASETTKRFGRIITGEKGIGRFAVRFLGRRLLLDSVAFDKGRRARTRLVATFDWPKFDRAEDLGLVDVPYRLLSVSDDTSLGTRLEIGALRSTLTATQLYAVRTASIGVLTPYHALLQNSTISREHESNGDQDPGFVLNIRPSVDESDDGDVTRAVLDNFVLRAVLSLRGDRLRLAIHRHGEKKPALEISDRYENRIGPVFADIRYFPQRKGTFASLPVDGRRAKAWVKKHPGVAVFDRTFRVHPYGLEGDDWLSLSADRVRSAREPRSTLATKHFPMDAATAVSTQLNYMLKLPYPEQLVGVVQVVGQRIRDAEDDDDRGLIAAADREGFLGNGAFKDLVDIIRGAVEAIAAADRELTQEIEREEQAATLKRLRIETRSAIKEIEKNPAIARGEKVRIVKYLAQTQELAEEHEERSKARESTMEVMSLLGVVAGYMTHEFGAAFSELEKVHEKLQKLARRDDGFKDVADAVGASIGNLREFVTYSQGYIHGATTRPTKAYGARTRLQRTVRVFGKYAVARNIDIQVDVEGDVSAPLVPVSLYDGIALNLFTNALKAVTAKAGNGERKITFRAWNDQQYHWLEVSDTGIGIPTALRDRVFTPMFTTTSTNRDPLGSGMGLGLSLVRRGAESFGGRVDVVDPPPGFTTCVRVRLPLTEPAK
jgi:signal transduction histidine kinase